MTPAVRRLLAFSCYLGLAPLLALFRAQPEDACLRHHKAQALAILLMLLPLALLDLAGLLALTRLLSTEAFLFDLALTWPVVEAYFVILGILSATHRGGTGLRRLDETRPPWCAATAAPGPRVWPCSGIASC